MRQKAKSAVFTLVELLVVVAITIILLSLLLPALGNARKSVMRVLCMSNMRNVYQGCVYYATDNNGWLPPTTSNAQHIGYINEYLMVKIDYWSKAKGAFGGYAWGPANRKPIGLYFCPALYPSASASPVWEGGAVQELYLSNYMQTISSSSGQKGCWLQVDESEAFRRLEAIKNSSAIFGESNYCRDQMIYNQAVRLYNTYRNAALDYRAPAWNLHSGSANFLFKDGHAKAYRQSFQLFDIDYVPAM